MASADRMADFVRILRDLNSENGKTRPTIFGLKKATRSRCRMGRRLYKVRESIVSLAAFMAKHGQQSSVSSSDILLPSHMAETGSKVSLEKRQVDSAVTRAITSIKTGLCVLQNEIDALKIEPCDQTSDVDDKPVLDLISDYADPCSKIAYYNIEDIGVDESREPELEDFQSQSSWNQSSADHARVMAEDLKNILDTIDEAHRKQQRDVQAKLAKYCALSRLSWNSSTARDETSIVRQRKTNMTPSVNTPQSDIFVDDANNTATEPDHRAPDEDDGNLLDQLEHQQSEQKDLSHWHSVESTVTSIARLQVMFNEHVLSQTSDIQTVRESTVASTENVRDGNEEIRKAIQNQASLRVYVLFFVLVMSFSLLFLDWYND